jgi:hypothetical protein
MAHVIGVICQTLTEQRTEVMPGSAASFCAGSWVRYTELSPESESTGFFIANVTDITKVPGTS